MATCSCLMLPIPVPRTVLIKISWVVSIHTCTRDPKRVLRTGV